MQNRTVYECVQEVRSIDRATQNNDAVLECSTLGLRFMFVHVQSILQNQALSTNINLGVHQVYGVHCVAIARYVIAIFAFTCQCPGASRRRCWHLQF